VEHFSTKYLGPRINNKLTRNGQQLQGIKLYTVDLTKIGGKGEFRCPKCGIKISPNDKTEDVYTVLEPVMKGDSLEKILLQCNRCGSQMSLTGFRFLNIIR